MNAARSALIVASESYADEKLRKLRAPARDASELARVLGDESIGGFDVDVSLDESEATVRRKLERFFQNRERDDLLLLHFSCHGIKDDEGQLYFATPDTDTHSLDSTAVAADFVDRQIRRSMSRRIVLLLDCCYSGAFARGSRAKAGSAVDLRERFEGRGRAVITASSAMEYAFEGDDVSGAGSPSIFTEALVRGLVSGEADHDEDGLISVDELYDHIYAEVRERTPKQTPRKWSDVEGQLIIAKSVRPVIVKPAELPRELTEATVNPLARIREGAVHELSQLALGGDVRVTLAVRLVLERMRDDDSRRVSELVASTLRELQPEETPAPASIERPIVPPWTAASSEDVAAAKTAAPPPELSEVPQSDASPTSEAEDADLAGSAAQPPSDDLTRRNTAVTHLGVRRRITVESGFLVGSAIAALLGAAAPWASDYYNEVSHLRTLHVAAAALTLAAVVLAVARRRWRKALLSGGSPLLAGVAMVLSIVVLIKVRQVSQDSSDVSTRWGLYLAIVGSACLMVSTSFRLVPRLRALTHLGVRRRITVESGFLVGSAIAALLGAAAPWASDYYNEVSHLRTLHVAAAALTLAAVVLAVARRRWRKALLSGGSALLAGVAMVLSIVVLIKVRQVSQDSSDVSTRWGLYLAIVGSTCLMVTAAFAAIRQVRTKTEVLAADA